MKKFLGIIWAGATSDISPKTNIKLFYLLGPKLKSKLNWLLWCHFPHLMILLTSIHKVTQKKT